MYDAVVIGLGAMGSAAACHLAQRGHAVLGLEQYPFIHALGSTHGQTRIVRQAYFEHPDYVPLLKKSYDLWEALDRGADEELINLCGLVLAGRTDDEIITGTKKAADLHGLPLEELDAETAAERFPGLHMARDSAVLHDPLGGYLRVERCVAAHLDRARAAGAILRENEALLSWRATTGHVEATTATGTYTARNLVLCAGPWAGHVLRDLKLPLQTHRVASAWFQTSNPAHELSAGAPVFAMQTQGSFFYGFPQLDGRGVKIAEHRAGALLHAPEDIDRNVTPHDIAPMVRFADRHVPGLRTDEWTANTCIYTMTPDHHFILDRHPQHQNVFLAAGFSGHGFKFSAVVGSILADFCERGRTDEPADFLGLSRFHSSGA